MPTAMPSPEALAAARKLNVNGLPDEHIAEVIDSHFALKINGILRERDDADHFIKELWRTNQLRSALPTRLYERLTKI